RLRQRCTDEPAAVAAGVERGHLPLAGGRSVEPGFLLLRRQGAGGPALLRAPLARRLSAGRRSQAAGAKDHGPVINRLVGNSASVRSGKVQSGFPKRSYANSNLKRDDDST